MNKLSDCEIETIEMAVSGMTNKQISEQRFVTQETVRNQLGAIYTKLGFKNGNKRVQLAVWYTKRQIEETTT